METVKYLGPPLPDELVEACEKAMNREREARYSSVHEFAQVISDWLDGAKKQEQALRIVEEALALNQQREEWQQQAEILAEEAKRGLKDIPSWEGENIKGKWWGKEQKSQELYQQAQLLDTIQEQQFQGALTHKSDLEEVHLELARRYQREHEEAEILCNVQKANHAKIRLREHASSLPENHDERTELFQYLKGTGAVSLLTDVEDAEVILEQYEPYHRRLVPKVIAHLGKTPILEHSLEMGSYRLRLRKEGHHEVFYPVSIGRGEHWDGRDPNGIQRPIHLPKLGELGKNDCYVPAGWFWAGGGPLTSRSLSRKQVWLDSIILRKFPVTNRDYLVFLDDLVQRGREEEALRYVPRARAGQAGQQGAMIYGRRSDGRFELVPDGDGDMWGLDWPVCMIDWHCCVAYTKWIAQRTGLPWRLPLELEWEKSARGVDGRSFTWGDGFDPSYCCMNQSHKGRMLPAVVDRFPIDESVYGVRGMSGNIVDWTASLRSESWAKILEDSEGVREETADVYRVYRGGCWGISSGYARLSYRYWNLSSIQDGYLGFRFCRTPQL